MLRTTCRAGLTPQGSDADQQHDDHNDEYLEGHVAVPTACPTEPRYSATVTHDFDEPAANCRGSSKSSSGDGGFTVDFSPPSLTGPWIYSPIAGVGGSGGWFTDAAGPELGSPMTTTVTSPVLAVSAGGLVSFSFDHLYSLEALVARS